MNKKEKLNAKITEMASEQARMLGELPTSAGGAAPDATLCAAVLCSTMFSRTMATVMEIMVDLFAEEGDK